MSYNGCINASRLTYKTVWQLFLSTLIGVALMHLDQLWPTWTILQGIWVRDENSEIWSCHLSFSSSSMPIENGFIRVACTETCILREHVFQNLIMTVIRYTIKLLMLKSSETFVVLLEQIIHSSCLSSYLFFATLVLANFLVSN